MQQDHIYKSRSKSRSFAFEIIALSKLFDFDYVYQSGNFNFMNKVLSGVANKTNIYDNIQKITYPTSATSEYTYEKISGSLGTGGYKEYYRVKTRVDNEADSTSYKSKTYDYTNEMSGYPGHSDPNNLPSDFLLITNIS